MESKYIRYILIQCLFALLIFLSLLYFYLKYEDTRHEYQLAHASHSTAYTLQNKIDSSKGVLISLAYNFALDPDLSEEEFNLLGSYFMEQNSDILFVQHKNQQTVTDMVYPSEYDYTLGASLYGRAEVEKAVRKAIDTKTITANPPYILKGTEDLLGLVIRYPLYHQDEFRGFFVVGMNVNDFIGKLITKDILKDYAVSLYDENGNLFWGDPDPEARLIHVDKIPVLDSFWTMEMSYRDNSFLSAGMFGFMATLLFLFVIGLLIYMQVGFFRKDRSILMLADLTEELEKTKESFSLALDSANDALWEWNIKAQNIFTSDKWEEITGSQMKGTGIMAILQQETIHPEDYEEALKSLESCLNGETSSFQCEYRINQPDGTTTWVLNKGKVYFGSNGEATKMAGSITNIQERKHRESRIEHLAYFDVLTGLPNKTHFEELLESKRRNFLHHQSPCTILMLDLDNFKMHNDSLGLDFCDQLLKHIGEKISAIAGTQNITARFGGDEFLILLSDTPTLKVAEDICQRILDIFRNPFLLDLKMVHITASIGMVHCQDPTFTVSETIRNADTALNKAKESGKNRYCIFDMNMHEEILRKSKVEACLRNALNQNDIQIHYQLQQCLKDDRIRGVEALARLWDPELGHVSPREFIEIAEITGLIVPFGNKILRKACLQGKEWLDKGYPIGKLSVNISANQLFQNNFYQNVNAILNETKFPVDLLELEITESVLFNSSEENLALLRSLKALGLHIALDDFGTGYSSLNYLTVLPIDTLKIDKSFIDRAFEGQLEHQIIRSIIDLAHQLDLHVVAEGVETEVQRSMLRQLNCDSIQGYLFARPGPPVDVESRLVHWDTK